MKFADKKCTGGVTRHYLIVDDPKTPEGRVVKRAHYVEQGDRIYWMVCEAKGPLRQNGRRYDGFVKRPLDAVKAIADVVADLCAQ